MPRPGVNGHGIHRIHGPEPNSQKNFFPLHPPTFSGKGGEHNFRGGVEGSRIVPSINCPEILGRTKNSCVSVAIPPGANREAVR